MDFNMKKLASGAGLFFTRAVQFTEEKLGQAERTELDAHFEPLVTRADATKLWTERIFSQMEVMLQPNPSVRMEEFLYEKLDRTAPKRLSSGQLLGRHMEDAARTLGPETPYGSTLLLVGDCEQRLGLAETELSQASAVALLNPLRHFLEVDWSNITKERRLLENRRLDLDACKTQPDFHETRPRNYVLSASASGLWTREAEKAADELRLAQAEFDKQAEVTKLLLEDISSTHVNHLRCLHEFVEAQALYYKQCHLHMEDLQKELAWYDADALITVHTVPGMDSDWLVGERGNHRGKVPVTYLELLS
ncbi:hypothetical protein NHX12_028256 [Muraenolepis orangiensis]|uniref:BAR domain-containing protein n=1 Tax=Muraenolepis orangiensis TaxID=630683 RepID=A0A9Q0ECY2_9TELE|nr:hypothetical protein NHX12_028256 [Muraenolepis orangiensis]